MLRSEYFYRWDHTWSGVKFWGGGCLHVHVQILIMGSVYVQS